MLDRPPIAPELTRRNIVVAGINLWILQSCVFEIGGALLEGSGPCPLCERMEENLGAGGYSAMRSLRHHRPGDSWWSCTEGRPCPIRVRHGRHRGP